MIVKQYYSQGMQNFSYILLDEKTKQAAVIDPSIAVNVILQDIHKNGWKVVFIINTHGHFDHTQGNAVIIKSTNAKLIAHVSSQENKDIAVTDGNTFNVGDIGIKVIHTPGHSPDSICLLAGNNLFTGDTLFVGECGRTDLGGGDSSAMYDSLFNKLLKLDDSIIVYPGHDYGNKRSSTIGFERQHNYTLKSRTKKEFIAFMKEP